MAAPILLNDGKMESDLDANFHRIINLDTSNLPPSGLPPTIHPNASFWLHDWDSTTQMWTATQPSFTDIRGFLTFEQQQAIFYLGTIQTGTWHALPIEPAYLPTLDLIQSPVGNVSMAAHRLTNVADPISAGDAVNKGFMDLLLQGLNPKEAVRLATTASIPLTGFQTVDGFLTNAGDRVLVKNMAGPEINGIYVVSAGSWTRATDADHGSGDAGFTDQNSIDRGCYCTVLEGADNDGTSWFQKDAVVHCYPHVGYDPIEFVIFSSPAAVEAGQGLGSIGNTFFINYTPNRTMATGDGIDISSNYVGQTSLTTLGTITTGTWHGNVIDGARGGTGVNNGANTIGLNANLSVTLGVGVSLGATLEFVLGNGATSVILPQSGTLSTLLGTETFQNKRLIARYGQVASNIAPSINTNLIDVFAITNLASPIASMTTNLTGTPTDGQELVIWIHDNGVARVITWGAKFTNGDGTNDPKLPLITTASKWMFNRFMWNTLLSQWVLTNALTSV